MSTTQSLKHDCRQHYIQVQIRPKYAQDEPTDTITASMASEDQVLYPPKETDQADENGEPPQLNDQFNFAQNSYFSCLDLENRQNDFFKFVNFIRTEDLKGNI